jgi:hypothetical protein
MTAFDGSPAEMPIPSGHADWRSPDEATAERLLSGQGTGPDAPPEEQTLALVLAAAACPATHRELSGEQAAVAAFELAVSGPRLGAPMWIRSGAGKARHALAHRIPVLISAGTLALLAALGGTAAAGALPPMLQKMAHSLFDAPAPAQVVPGRNISREPATVGPHRAGPTSPARTLRHKTKNTKGKAKGKAKGKQQATSSASTSSSDNGQGNDKGNDKGNGKAKHHAKANGQGNGNGNGNGNAKCHGNGKKSCDQTARLRRPKCPKPPRGKHRHRRAHLLVARSDCLPAQVPCVHAFADDRQLHPGKRDIEGQVA